MSIEKCIEARVAAGELTQEQADAAKRYIKDRRASTGYAPGSAEEAADLAMMASKMKEDARAARNRTSRQAIAQAQALRWVEDHPGGILHDTPENKTFYGVASVFAPDKTGTATHVSLEGTAIAYTRAMQGMFSQGIDAMRSKMAGLKAQTTNMRDFIHEVFGENRGNVGARAAAQSWNDMIGWAVKEWKSLGGQLDRLDLWRVPQQHDSRLIAHAGYDTWNASIADLEAQGGVKILDWKTQAPALPAKRDAILREMYESITTDGANKINPGENTQPGLANSRNQRRVLEFTTPDAWRSYHNAYGPGESQIFDMLTGYMDGMAHDLAALKVLGPRPDHTARVLVDTARKAGVSPSRVHFLETLYQHASGQANATVSDTLARFGKETRSFLTASQLGGAFLSSMGVDHLSAGITAKFNGLPVWDTMWRYLKLMNPANAEDRRSAWRLGLGAESQTHRLSGAAVEHMNATRGLGTKIADTVMRVSLLEAHTNAMQHALGWEFLSTLADQSGKTLDQLKPAQKAFMERYGMTAKDWDITRANIIDMDGLPIVDPHWLIKQGGDAETAGMKLLQGIAVEQRFGTPMPGAFERAAMLWGSKPGTVLGEATRSFWQYKGFPVTVLTTHVLRGISQARREGKYWYIPGFVIGSTLMGAVGLQLKAIAQGKDMREPDAKFWGAAFIQGGGAGIMGDFLNSSVSRTGKDVMLTMAGPTVGLGADLLSLTGGNLGQAFTDKDTNIGREAAKFAQRYTPGSSLWYARLAAERWLWNSLQEWVDPRYQESFRRTEANAFRETGQQYWWRPGAATPARAPVVAGN